MCRILGLPGSVERRAISPRCSESMIRSRAAASMAKNVMLRCAAQLSRACERRA